MKVTFCVFWSLCSAGEIYRLISSPYIFACTACSAIQFGTEMNLPKTYKPYKKRACLLRIDWVNRLFTASRPKFHRVQCKFEDPLSARRLVPIPMTVDINDLRMRINLQHPGCFCLAAICVKNVYLLNVWRPIVPVLFFWPHPGLCKLVCMDVLYKRSKFQLNRMRNRRVIRGQNIRHSIPTFTASLSLKWPSPIGMKLVPDERSGPRTH